ncbi:MAG: hypothetical protein GVY26_07440, partial [Bacteroidetes bacterium]|nr:hypothetical protein [Bacteroidota bacterium]
GNFSLTFTPDPGQCANPANLSVEVQPAITPTLSPQGPFCATETPVVLPSAQSGVSGTWSGPGVDASIFDPAAALPGDNLLTFTPNPGECASPATLSVFVNPAVTPTPAPIGPFCSEDSPVALPGTVSGIDGIWSGSGVVGGAFAPSSAFLGPNTLTFTPLPGECGTEAFLDVTVNPQPVLDPIADETSCGDFVLPPITGSDLTGNQAYFTEPNGQGMMLSPSDAVDASGTYYAYDAAMGCADEAAFTVTVSETLSTSCTVLSNVSAGGSNDGSLRVSIDMGTAAPYSISWSGPASGTLNSSTLDNDIDNLPAGTYTIETTDANGCSATCTPTITALSDCNLTASATTVPVTCAGGSDGAINVIVNGSTGFVVFDWNETGIDGQQNPTGLSAGNYTVTVIDEEGCSDIVSAVVEDGPALDIACTVTSPASGPMAMDGSMEVDIAGGTGPYEINYSGPVFGTQAGAAGINTINNLPPGDYFIIVEDDEGCTADCSFTITGCGLIVNLTTTEPTCAGDADGTIEVSASGGVAPLSYDWLNDNFDGMSTLSGLEAGLYLVTVTDANNCEVSANVLLNEPAGPVVSCNVLVPTTAPSANEGAADILLNGGTPPYSLEVQGPATFSFTEPAPGVVNIDNLPGGYYTSTLTDANGCESSCSFYIETQPCPMTADFQLPDPLCEGDSGQIQITLMNETAPVVYDWSVDSLDGQSSPSGLVSGEYGITIVDDAGCVIDTTLEILPSELKLQCEVASVESAPGAADGEAELTFDGFYPPFDISWTGPVNGSQNGSAGGIFTITGLVAGDYEVVVEDANGCTQTCSFTMNLMACGATLYAEVQSATCPNSADGSIDLTIDGGDPPFTFIWNNGDNTEDITGLEPGIYEFRAVDDMGCDLSGLFVIDTLNPAPSVETMASGTTICPSECVVYDLSFSGTAPYQLEYQVRSNTFDQTFNLSVAAADTTIEICPNALGIPEDEFRVEFLSLQDAVCEGNPTQADIIRILQPVEQTLTRDLCEGESLVVNGTTYDASNPSGTEVFVGVTANGCDSTVFVDLNFVFPNVENINEALCPGDSLVVNGVTYNEATPMGTDTIPGGAVNGCDSIINVAVTYLVPDTTQLMADLCEGDSLVVNGTTYNEALPIGTEVLEGAAASGCDSIINVALNFLPLPDTADFTAEICPGESIIVNGTVYDESQLTGTEVLPGAAANGCDSVVNVMLTVLPTDTADFTAEICPGESIIVNGTVYDESQLTGTEVLPGAAANGCDSIVNVALTVLPTDTADFTAEICPGESIIVNGTVYDESQLTGTEVLPGAAASGCDSLVNVTLTVLPIDTFDLMATLCPGESLQVNGTTYNEAMPAGVEVLEDAAANGCDSVINVMVSYFPEDTTFIQQQLCTGDSLIVNGTTYNESNPSGTELLPNGKVNGCDSLISVMLTFGGASVNDINQTLCPGDSLVVNGITYNEAMPMGVDTIPNGSASGCDSVINVTLTFFDLDTADLEVELCQGESLVVNGTTYDEAMPTGTEVFPAANANGCDSIINVMLTFTAPDTNFLTPQLCPGDSLVVNGTVYNEAMPSGIEVLENAAATGCDSIVSVMLDFLPPPDTAIVNAALCPGESLTVNGTVYNEALPSGTEVLPGAAANGCDSIVNVALTFFPLDTTDIQQQLCTGDSLMVNGTVYDEANPSGIEVIAGGAATGCDSIISVDLSFGGASVNDISETLCPGESLTVNGTVYDETMPMGSDTIPG